MSVLPFHINFTSCFTTPLSSENTVNIPSVSLTLFLLLMSFAGGFAAAVLINIGEASLPSFSSTRNRINDLGLPFIVYDQGDSDEGWITYSNNVHNFSISFPSDGDSLRFIDRPHTIADYTQPFSSSLLIRQGELSSPEELKTDIILQGHLLIREDTITLDGEVATQYEFSVGTSQSEVYTLVELEGNNYLILSYLFYPEDLKTGRGKQLESILNSFTITK